MCPANNPQNTLPLGTPRIPPLGLHVPFQGRLVPRQQPPKHHSLRKNHPKPPGFLSRFEGAQCPAKLLEEITIVDTPGVLSGEKQRIGGASTFCWERGESGGLGKGRGAR